MYRVGLVFGGRGDLAHHDVDLAGGNGHNDPLNCTNFVVRDVLCLGYAKVVLHSWLAFPGHGCSQTDHCCGAGIEMLFVTNAVVEVAVGFVLFGWQHDCAPVAELFSSSNSDCSGYGCFL